MAVSLLFFAAVRDNGSAPVKPTRAHTSSVAFGAWVTVSAALAQMAFWNKIAHRGRGQQHRGRNSLRVWRILQLARRRHGGPPRSSPPDSGPGARCRYGPPSPDRHRCPRPPKAPCSVPPGGLVTHFLRPIHSVRSSSPGDTRRRLLRCAALDTWRTTKRAPTRSHRARRSRGDGGIAMNPPPLRLVNPPIIGKPTRARVQSRFVRSRWQRCCAYQLPRKMRHFGVEPTTEVPRRHVGELETTVTVSVGPLRCRR